jgi:hypothetical protein
VSEAIVLPAADLVPESWREEFGSGPIRLFNPGLVRSGAGWILAYRVVGPDLARRIALCRLDERLAPAGPAVAFSDLVRFRPGHDLAPVARSWFADPRLHRLRGELWLYWNSGWHEPANHQFLQRVDPATLRPLSWPRELLLAGERRPIEKNWLLFGEDDPRIVYSISPHRVLRPSFEGEGDVLCRGESSVGWERPSWCGPHGDLRGGAPPVGRGNEMTSFCHSIAGTHPPYRYVPAVYRFSALPPYAPTASPQGPLPLPNPFGARTVHERLNPAVGEVLYPCGAAREGERWIVAYGINDEQCALALLSDAEVEAALEPARGLSGG